MCGVVFLSSGIPPYVRSSKHPFTHNNKLIQENNMERKVINNIVVAMPTASVSANRADREFWFINKLSVQALLDNREHLDMDDVSYLIECKFKTNALLVAIDEFANTVREGMAASTSTFGRPAGSVLNLGTRVVKDSAIKLYNGGAQGTGKRR